MPKQYFTRLTPNFNNWKAPSGRDGKCHAANPTKPLYEETHGFGWEEWLFEEYFAQIDNPEFECKGFLEAYNQQNENNSHAVRIYLYTKVCSNKKGIDPGCYYVGYIDNVQRIESLRKDENEVRRELTAVDINHNEFIDMLPFAKNISFKVKDVHINFNNVFQQPIQLHRWQFRFALYDLNDHPNFIINFSKKI
jgi:hypothetical protein